MKYTGCDMGIITAIEQANNKFNQMLPVPDVPFIAEAQDLKGIIMDGKRMVHYYRNYANADPRDYVKTLWEKFAGQVIDVIYRNE